MLERFIAEYSDKGFQFAYKLCGNVEDAKELVQEAFARILRRWDQFDQSQPLETYFLSVLRHIYYDGLKRYDRRNVCSLSAEPEGEGEALADRLGDESGEMLELLERQDARDRVNAAFDALSPEHRAILTLSDVQGMSYEEIAAVLDCPGGTVRSRLSRARRAFKGNISKHSEVMNP